MEVTVVEGDLIEFQEFTYPKSERFRWYMLFENRSHFEPLPKKKSSDDCFGPDGDFNLLILAGDFAFDGDNTRRRLLGDVDDGES